MICCCSRQYIYQEGSARDQDLSYVPDHFFPFPLVCGWLPHARTGWDPGPCWFTIFQCIIIMVDNNNLHCIKNLPLLAKIKKSHINGHFFELPVFTPVEQSLLIYIKNEYEVPYVVATVGDHRCRRNNRGVVNEKDVNIWKGK